MTIMVILYDLHTLEFACSVGVCRQSVNNQQL